MNNIRNVDLMFTYVIILYNKINNILQVYYRKVKVKNTGKKTFSYEL